MRKYDVFFIRVFALCYLFSVIYLTGFYFYDKSEKSGDYTDGIVADKGEADDVTETEHETEAGSEAGTERETEAGSENGTEQGTETDSEPVGYEYFSDALFIGDSRTVGLKEYGGIESADFFADFGMSVFKLEKSKIAVGNGQKKSFNEVLSGKKYGKIYLMLGINELGYQFDSIEKKYTEILERIREKQPDAVIYLCANMHVTEEHSRKDDIYNNENINRVNAMISKRASDKMTVYLDVNELFDDEAGALKKEYSGDSFHVYGKYYKDWTDWLCTKVVIN